MAENMEVDELLSRETVLSLITKKEGIEKEISQLKEILDLNSVGMQEPLVDTEGYPREDIDVYQVRHARHRIIRLQNDHKAVMKEIEAGLHAVHSRIRDGLEGTGGSSTGKYVRDLSPIAHVDLVHDGSPAALAGLQAGDLILQFGTVTDVNFSSLRDIGCVVEHSIGRKVALTVLRDTKPVRLSLTPKRWSGKGVLGCNILPIESVDR